MDSHYPTPAEMHDMMEAQVSAKVASGEITGAQAVQLQREIQRSRDRIIGRKYVSAAPSKPVHKDERNEFQQQVSKSADRRIRCEQAAIAKLYALADELAEECRLLEEQQLSPDSQMAGVSILSHAAYHLRQRMDADVRL